MAAAAPFERLTQRQLEVLELVAKGLTNAEIAKVLAIAPATAKNHVSAVLQALDVTNRTEAVGLLQDLAGGGPSAQIGGVPGFGGRPAIAVLAFDDFSEEPDPAFAAGLVEDLTTRLARRRWFARAREAAREAVALDPEDATAHTALGSALALLRQSEEAQRALRCALELDPSSALASFAYGSAILSHPTAEESLHFFERALRLSPLDPLAHDFVGAVAVASYLAGRHEQAIAAAQRSIASERAAGLSYEAVIPASLFRLGRDTDAREAARALHARFPHASLEPSRLFADGAVIDDLQEALRAVGLEL